MYLQPENQQGVRPVLKSTREGGSKGVPFDDTKNSKNGIYNLRSLTIASGDQVYSIQATYLLFDGSLYKAPKHGRSFKNQNTITLVEDEYISKIEGSTTDNSIISQLFVTTKRPEEFQTRTYGPFGKRAGEHNFTFEGHVLGFHGRAGKALNSIGVYHLAPVKESGSMGYNIVRFYEHPDAKFPPVIKLVKLFIHHGSKVDSLQAQYLLHGGKTRLGKRFGGTGGNPTTLKFSSDEVFVGVEGRLDSIFDDINEMSFISWNVKNEWTIYGPFGLNGDPERPFSFNNNRSILGYKGDILHNTMNSIVLYYF